MTATAKLLQMGAAGAAGEATYVEDVFSTYLYTGNGSSQAITNGIALGSSNAGGSIYLAGPNTSSYVLAPSSSAFALGSGDFTIECWFQASNTSQNAGLFQISSDSSGFSATAANQLSIQLYIATVYLGSNGGFSATTSTSYAAGTWYHLALVRNGSALTVYINGVNKLSVTDSYNYTGTYLNIGGFYGGQYTFAGYISNFRIVKGTAVYTGNFTPPTSALTAISGTSILTGQGDSPLTDNSSNAFVLTTYGTVTANIFGPFTASEAGEGGMTWIKCRNISYTHRLFDTVRGATKFLITNDTLAEDTNTSTLTQFSSSGFSVGASTAVNENSSTYASWTFRKAEKFFDIVTYTGNGANRTISHNLGSVPGCMIIKAVSGTNADIYSWAVYHRSLNASSGGPQNSQLYLNSTSAQVYGTDYWNSTNPTSTVFSLGANLLVNANGVSYVAYLFAHNAGGFGLAGDQNVVTCGSFTTDGSGNATVNLGYEPQWILFKSSSAAQDWYVLDNMRGWTVDGSQAQTLRPNTTAAEANFWANAAGINSTGFTITGTTANRTYIYVVIRRGPMKVPEMGTSVFSPVARTGTGSSTTVTAPGFAPDLLIDASRTAANTGGKWWFDKLRGVSLVLNSTNSNAESSAYSDSVTAMTNTGYTIGADSNNIINYSGETYINWVFQRAPSFFDEVCYTGNASSGLVVNHNLGVIPELVIFKRRASGAGGWPVWTTSVGTGTSFTYLNTTLAVANQGVQIFTSTPTTTSMTLGSWVGVNDSNTMVAYLFATCPGVSKVGSYTGTGTTLQVNCGFTNGARFVLIKRTDSTGDWYVWDSARGIVAGNDPYLLLNSTAAEVTNTDYVDTYSAGFEITSTAPAAINANGGTYIFLAIA